MPFCIARESIIGYACTFPPLHKEISDGSAYSLGHYLIGCGREGHYDENYPSKTLWDCQKEKELDQLESLPL